MTKFYRCAHCGNIVEMIEDKHVPIFCCGEKMQELVPNTSDGANEKHVPVVSIIGDTCHVAVASVAHPMEEAHSIQWIYVETNKGGMIKYLKPHEVPAADFKLADGEQLVAVYEYCNLHGLWSAAL